VSSLPQQLDWNMAQNRWASILNPVVNSPIVNGRMLTNVALINGTTIVNHGLGRTLQGWIIAGINGAATIYDNQTTNQLKDLTLSLTSNAAVIAQIWVF
jgi:hypothetical protein